MKYRGSCHCGNVRFEIEGEIDRIMDCNCSICARKGALLWFVPRDTVTLLTPEENLADYTFGSGTIHHRFCKTCGIHPLGFGVMPDGRRMAAINVRCLEDFDHTKVPVEHFDGRSL